MMRSYVPVGDFIFFNFGFKTIQSILRDLLLFFKNSKSLFIHNQLVQIRLY